METETWKHEEMKTWERWNSDILRKNIKQKTEAQTIFPNTFTVCSSCIQKFVVFAFDDEETKGSYPFANRLNGLAVM